MTDIRTDPDPDAAAAAVEAIATGHEGSLSEQFQNYFSRVRSGEMGMLPALAGVLVLGVLFSFLSEFFLTNKNIANLLTQTAAPDDPGDRPDLPADHGRDSTSPQASPAASAWRSSSGSSTTSTGTGSCASSSPCSPGS
jgi:hypothetical protein